MNDERQRKLQAGREKLRAYQQRKKKPRKAEHDVGDASGDTSDASQASDTSQLASQSYDSDSTTAGHVNEQVLQQQPQLLLQDESDTGSVSSLTGGSGDERSSDEHRWYADRLSELEERLLGKEEAIRSLADEANSGTAQIQNLEHQLEAKDVLIRQIGDQYAHNVGLLEERIYSLQEQLRQASEALHTGGSGRRSPAEAAAAVAQSMQETKDEVRAMRREFELAIRQRDEAVVRAHEAEIALQQRDEALLELERRARERAVDAERLSAEVQRLTAELDEKEVTMQALAAKMATRAQELSEAMERLRLATERENASARVVLQLQTELERHSTTGSSGGRQVVTIAEHQQKLDALRAELDEQHGMQIAQLMSVLASEKQTAAATTDADASGEPPTTTAGFSGDRDASALGQRLSDVVAENERLVAQVRHWEGWYQAAQEQMVLQQQQQMLAYAESLRAELQVAHAASVQSLMSAKEDEIAALSARIRELDTIREEVAASSVGTVTVASLQQPDAMAADKISSRTSGSSERGVVDAGRPVDDDERSVYLSKIAALQLQIEDLVSRDMATRSAAAMPLAPVATSEAVPAAALAVEDAGHVAMYEDQVATLREQLDAVRTRLRDSDRQHQLLAAELESVRAAHAAGASSTIAVSGLSSTGLVVEGSTQTEEETAVAPGIRAVDARFAGGLTSFASEVTAGEDGGRASVPAKVELLHGVDSGEVAVSPAVVIVNLLGSEVVTAGNESVSSSDDASHAHAGPAAAKEQHRLVESVAAPVSSIDEKVAMLEHTLEEERNVRRHLERECEALASNCKSCQEDAERLTEILQSKADESASLANEVTDMQDKLERCEAILSSLSIARDGLAVEAADLGRRLIDEQAAGERLRLELDDALRQLREATEAVADAELLRSRLAVAEERLREAQERIAAADVVSTQVQEEFAARLSRSEAERDELRQLTDELQAVVDRASGERAEFERRAGDKIREALAEAAARREDVEVELVKQRAELVAAAHRAEALDEALAAAGRRAAELEQNCASLESDLNEARSIAEATQFERDRTRAELADVAARHGDTVRELQSRYEADLEVRELAALERIREAVAAAHSEAQQRLAVALTDRVSELEREADRRIAGECQLAAAAEHERQKEQHCKELAELTLDWEQRLADAVTALQGEHRAQLLAVKEINEREWQREVTAMMTTHGKDLEAVRAELDAARLDSLSELREELERAHRDEATALLLRNEHESKLQLESVKLVMHQVYAAQLDSTRTELEQLAASRQTELAERHRAELSVAEGDHRQRVAELEQRHAEDVHRLTVEFESKKQDLLRQLSGDQESVVAVWTHRVEELEEELTKLRTSSALDREARERELADALLDRDQLLKTAEESRERLGRVHSQEIAELQCQLQVQYEAAMSRLRDLSGEERDILIRSHEEQVDALRADVCQLRATLEHEFELKLEVRRLHEEELAEMTRLFEERLQQQHLERQPHQEKPHQLAAEPHVTEAERLADVAEGTRCSPAEEPTIERLDCTSLAVIPKHAAEDASPMGDSAHVTDMVDSTTAERGESKTTFESVPAAVAPLLDKDATLYSADDSALGDMKVADALQGQQLQLVPQEQQQQEQQGQQQQHMEALVELAIADRLATALAERRTVHDAELAELERCLVERHLSDMQTIHDEADAERTRREAESAQLIESWRQRLAETVAELESLRVATTEAAEQHVRDLQEAVRSRSAAEAKASEEVERGLSDLRVSLESQWNERLLADLQQQRDEVSEHLRQEHEERVRQLIDDHERRLSELRESVESQWNQRLLAELQQQRDEVAEHLRQEHEERVRQLIDDHQRHVEALRVEHELRQSALDGEQHAEADRMREEHERRVAEMVAAHRLESDALSRRAEAVDEELRFLRKSLESGEAPEISQLKEALKAQFDSELLIMKSTMKEEFDEVTRVMQEQAARRLEAEQTTFIERHSQLVEKFTVEHDRELDEAHEQARASLELQRQELNTEHEAQLAALARERDEHEQSWRADLDRQRAELQAAGEQLVLAEQQDRERQLVELRTEHELRLAELLANHERQTEERRIEHERRLAELSAEHERRLEELRQEHAVETARVAELAKEKAVSELSAERIVLLQDAELSHAERLRELSDQLDAQYTERLRAADEATQDAFVQRDAELAELRCAIEEERKQAKVDRSAALDTLDSDWRQRAAEAERRLGEELNAAHAAELELVRRTADEATERVRDELERQHQGEIGALQKQYEETLAVWQRNMNELMAEQESIRQENLQRLDALRHEHDRRVSELQLGAERLLVDLESTESSLAEVTSTLSRVSSELDAERRSHTADVSRLEVQLLERTASMECLRADVERLELQRLTLVHNQKLFIDLFGCMTKNNATVEARISALLGSGLSPHELQLPSHELQLPSRELAAAGPADVGTVAGVEHDRAELGASSSPSGAAASTVPASACDGQGGEDSATIDEILDCESAIKLADDIQLSSRRVADSIEHALGALERSVTQLVEAHRMREELVAELQRGRVALATLEERATSSQERLHELNEQMAADAEARCNLEVELHKTRGLLDGYVAEREHQDETVRMLEEKRCSLAVSCEQLHDRVRQLEELRGESEAAQLCAQRQQEAMALSGSEAQTALLRQNSQLDREKRDMSRQFEREREELLHRLHDAEQKADEAAREGERLAERHIAQLQDLQLQLDSAERQLRANRLFMEEQTAEREQEREQSHRYMQQCQAAAEERRRLEATVSELQVQVTDLRVAQQLAASSNAESSADLASAVRHEMSEARQLTVALRQDLDAKEAVIKELTEKLATVTADLAAATSAHDTIERKDVEIASLAEQLEGFREQLLEKTEQLQQVSLQLEVSNQAAAYMKSELENRLHRLHDDLCKLRASQADGDDPGTEKDVAAAGSEQAAADEPHVVTEIRQSAQMLSAPLLGVVSDSSSAIATPAAGTSGGAASEAEGELVTSVGEGNAEDDDPGVLRVRLAEREALAEEYAMRLQAQRIEIESLAEFQAKLQDDFDSVAGMLEAKEAEIDRLSRLLADAEHAVEAKASSEHQIAELRRAVKEKDNVINEKEEDMYTLNEELQKAVQQKSALEADLLRHRMELAERDMLVAALRRQISTAVGVSRAAGAGAAGGGGDADTTDEGLSVEQPSGAVPSSDGSAASADYRRVEDQRLRDELELCQAALSKVKDELDRLKIDFDDQLRVAVREAEEEFGIRLDVAEVEHNRALLELEERHEKELAVSLDRLKKHLGVSVSSPTAVGPNDPATSVCDPDDEVRQPGKSVPLPKSTDDTPSVSESEPRAVSEPASCRRRQQPHRPQLQDDGAQSDLAASAPVATDLADLELGSHQPRIRRGLHGRRISGESDLEEDELQQLLDSLRCEGTEILTLSSRSQQQEHVTQLQASRELGVSQQRRHRSPTQKSARRLRLSSAGDDDVNGGSDDYLGCCEGQSRPSSTLDSIRGRRRDPIGSGSWTDERRALFAAIDSMKDVIDEADPTSGLSMLSDLTLTDWRAQLLRSFIRLFAKERLALVSELRQLATAGATPPSSADAVGSTPAASTTPRGATSATTQWWQQRLEWLERTAASQASLQADTIDALLAADRQSLLNEARELRAHIGLSQAQHSSVLRQLRDQTEAREERSNVQLRSLRAQVELLEYKLTQEKVIADDLRASFDSEHQRLVAQSAELDSVKDASAELSLSLSAVQAEAMRLREAVDWRDQQLATAREQMDSAKRFYEDERAKTERLMDLLRKEQSVHEELKEQAGESHRRALAAHAQAAEKLRVDLEAERSRCSDALSAAERERLSAAASRRELETVRADWERLERKLRDGAAELRESLEAERSKCAGLTSAIQRERQQVEQLQERLSNERQRRAAVASTGTSPRPSSSAAELERQAAAGAAVALELEAERSRCLELLAAVEREKARSVTAQSALDSERLLRCEEIERERAASRQLKKTLDIVECRCQELQRQLLDEKTKADQLQERLDMLQRSLAEAETKEAQRDAARERQRISEQQRMAREREDYRHHKSDAELQNQRLRRQVVELQLLLAQREHNHAVEHRDLLLMRHSTTSPPPMSSSPRLAGARTASPTFGRRHSSSGIPLDLQGSDVVYGGRCLSPSAAVHLESDKSPTACDSGSASSWWRQMELLRQRLHFVAVQLQELSCDNDAVLDVVFDELRHMQHVFSSAHPPESDVFSVPLLSSVDNVLRHNAQLTSYAAKLSAEKLELRGALSKLAASDSPRRRPASAALASSPALAPLSSRSDRRTTSGGAATAPEDSDGCETRAKEKWMMERLSLVRAVEEAEGKAIRARRDQRLAEAKLAAYQTSAANVSVMSNGSFIGSGSHEKLQKMYGKYLRAESFRKALVYQKKYLLLLLGGFQETEAETLQAIAKPDRDRLAPLAAQHAEQAAQTISPKARFRSAARTALAVCRMKFLVKKWQKTVARLPGVLKIGGDRVSSGLRHGAQPPTATAAPLRRAGDRHQPEGAVRQHATAAVVHAPSPALSATNTSFASANGSSGSQYLRQRPLSSCLNGGRTDSLTDGSRSTADAPLSSRPLHADVEAPVASATAEKRRFSGSGESSSVAPPALAAGLSAGGGGSPRGDEQLSRHQHDERDIVGSGSPEPWLAGLAAALPNGNARPERPDDDTNGLRATSPADPATVAGSGDDLGERVRQQLGSTTSAQSAT